MKFLLPLFAFLAVFTFSSCDDDETIVTIDSSQPNNFVAARSGSLTAQNGTPTAGTVELGEDDDARTFLRLGNDFTTEQGTGTVTVYLSTSDTFTPSPGTGNPDLILVGGLNSNGEQFFQIDRDVPASFTHVILWCASANIPFGNARIQ
ncbi:DM13 domain-containing protein [Neolewinella aurantiaca]|uniref:DM13 domain-containing protein n=1 Tax=Neolewinella aurantiaca TaxID=2602767 RepID=A0A5C7FC12_9BACT|nr:DM13 domain-containing protein [Neolewinella aurantiaca]TXF87663.1 DM13 domain-containing protein [Neolewinella aurantiaca]